MVPKTRGVRSACGPLLFPIVTGPLIVPLPARVLPLTVTGPVPVAEPTVLLTTNLPAVT